MIVFLDINNKVVKLYSDKGMKNIPFDQIETIHYHLNGADKVMYVTGAMNAPVGDLINLVRSQTGNALPTTPTDPLNDPLHVRFTGKGVLNVTDLGHTDKEGNLEPESFRGPVDFKPLDHLKKKGFDTSIQVRALLKAGKLEVLPLSACQKIRIDYDKQNDSDRELENMTIPEGMSMAEYVKKVQSGEIKVGQDRDDAIEIDLNATARFGGGGAGGGKFGNEGGLLPKDFTG